MKENGGVDLASPCKNMIHEDHYSNKKKAKINQFKFS